MGAKTCMRSRHWFAVVSVESDMFAHFVVTSHLEVPLTTIEQDFYAMGQQAAKLLLAAIPEAGAEASPIIRVPVSLIERKSTAIRCR